MARDTALAVRVAGVLAALLAADALLVAATAALLRPWVAPLVGGSQAVGAVAVVAVTAALAWAQLRYARRETLAAAGARPVTDDEYPDLYGRIRRLSQAADLRTPDLAVADTDVPNSLTVGGLGGATVAVSTGLLETLSDDQLDAVLAHELAHLRNRDATVMTFATFLPALAAADGPPLAALGPATRRLALAVVAVVGYAVSTAVASVPPFSLASLLAFGGFVAFTLVFGGVALGLLAMPAVALAGYLARAREFAADRAGALLAGDPAAMATALETLDAVERPREDARHAGVRELCFLPHGVGAGGDDPIADLPLDVSTHPPTDERVARLRELQSEGEAAYR